MEQGGSERSLSTLENAFEIVEILQQEGGATVDQLVEHTELSESTLYVYVSTLRKRGYLRRDGSLYHVGLKYLDHGMYAREEYDELITTAKPIMQNLAEETGEAVWLVTEENGVGVYLEVAKGEHAIPTGVRIGSRRPLHVLSAGKAILSELSRSRIREIVDDHGLEKGTTSSISSESELFEELEITNQQGYAYNDGEVLEGIRAVGAPICKGGEVLGAVSVTAPESRMKGDPFREEYPELVKSAAGEIELNLTYSLV